MVSDDSVQTLEIFEDFAGSLHSSASCHCNHYNHYYNHCTSFCMFLKIYCTILILLLALARTVPDWFHPMIFLFPRVSQFWDASHRSGESGECLGWFWSQQWFHRIIKTKPSLDGPNVHLLLLCVCLFLFVLCLCLPLWLTREEKVESEEARQAGRRSREVGTREETTSLILSSASPSLSAQCRTNTLASHDSTLYYAKCNAKCALQA